MSRQLIQQYHAQVEKIIRYGGSRKETAVRKPFQDVIELIDRVTAVSVNDGDYRENAIGSDKL